MTEGEKHIAENNEEKKTAEAKKENREKFEKTGESSKFSKEKKIVKKEEAIAHAKNLHVSKRHGVYICQFIKNKKIDAAIRDLEEVIKLKKAVPFKGEIPHRKGKIMSGRYPIKGAKLFLPLLKGLKGNALVNGLDLDKTVINYASANFGFRPAKRTGGKAKRTNILLKAKELEGKN